MSGKEGDFLVQDREGGQWIVNGDTFHETYEPSILSQHNRLLDSMAKQSERGLLQDADDPLAAVYLGRKRREEMTELLEGTANEWDFDVFELERITHGHPLFHLASYLFEAHGLVGSLGVKPDIFAQFLLHCESQCVGGSPPPRGVLGALRSQTPLRFGSPGTTQTRTTTPRTPPTCYSASPTSCSTRT